MISDGKGNREDKGTRRRGERKQFAVSPCHRVAPSEVYRRPNYEDDVIYPHHRFGLDAFRIC